MTRTHSGLEDEEDMGIIMRVELFTSIAQVFGAVGTSEPFPLNASHATIAHCRRVNESL